MGTHKFKQYETTNLSFAEVWSGEYALPLTFEPATVLDIGANEGAFTAWALEHWAGAKVISFEPVPANAALFRQNIANNPRVNFSELAIAIKSQIKLFHGRHNSGQFSALKTDQNTDESITVNAIQPTDLPSCEFVKVDIEGMELDVIPSLDLSKTKVIAFEYHNQPAAQKLDEYLEKLGFEQIEHRMHSGQRGTLKYARPGAVVQNVRVKQPIRLFIGVPSFFSIDPHFHRCLLETYGWMARQSEIHGTIAHSFGDSPHVGRARNNLTRQFLESDCTDLLFIDSDLVFSHEHVERILSHDEEVVGGMYFKKMQEKAEPCLNTTCSPIVKPNGLNQVAYIGTGFLRIKRIVFEKIIERFGDDIAYCPDGSQDILEYNFWNLAMHTFDRDSVILPDQNRMQRLMNKYGASAERVEKAIRTRWLSEDWWFCQRCMDLGFKVWADRHICLRHSGNILYPLASQEEAIFGRKIIYGSAPKGSDVAADIAAIPSEVAAA
jgi:FkbM family methyltransferase